MNFMEIFFILKEVIKTIWHRSPWVLHRATDPVIEKKSIYDDETIISG